MDDICRECCGTGMVNMGPYERDGVDVKEPCRDCNEGRLRAHTPRPPQPTSDVLLDRAIAEETQRLRAEGLKKEPCASCWCLFIQSLDESWDNCPDCRNRYRREDDE